MGLFNNFFGGNNWLNPAGTLHAKQYKKEQGEADAAVQAAKAQEAAAQAQLKAQQEAMTLQAEQAALAATQGTDTRTGTAQTGGGIDAANPLRKTRKRGADVTVGL